MVYSFSYRIGLLLFVLDVFRLSRKIPDANALFTHAVTVLKAKSHFLKRGVRSFPDEALLTSKSFMNVTM